MLITFTGLTTIIILIQLYRYFNIVLQLRKAYNTVGAMKDPAMQQLEKVKKSIFLQIVIISIFILLIALIVWCIRLLNFRVKH